MASGLGSGPCCHPVTNVSKQISSLVSSKDKFCSSFSGYLDRPQPTCLRWRASGTQASESASQRKPREIGRRTLLSITTFSIQPLFVWGSLADIQDLNESQKIYQLFLEKIKERMELKKSVPAVEEIPAPSPEVEAPVTAPEEPEVPEEASTESASEASNSEPEVADDTAETVEPEATEAAVEEAGEPAEDVSVSDPADEESPAPVDEPIPEEPVSASSDSGEALLPSQEASVSAGDEVPAVVEAAPAESELPGVAESGAVLEEPVSAPSEPEAPAESLPVVNAEAQVSEALEEAVPASDDLRYLLPEDTLKSLADTFQVIAQALS